MTDQPITAAHEWIAAATIAVDDRTAGVAHRRGTMRIQVAMEVEVLETYCRACRRAYRDIRDEACEAGGAHLIGGHADGSRKKRGPQNKGVILSASA